MRSKLPWPEILVTALVLLAGAGVYLYAHRDEGALEESKRRGELLVEALHTYEREHGSYPEGLENLVPEHVATLEPPTWGLRRWRYRRYAPTDAVRPLGETEAAGTESRAERVDAGAPAETTASGESSVGVERGQQVYFQLSVAADESGYPVLYYDFASRRWVLNN